MTTWKRDPQLEAEYVKMYLEHYPYKEIRPILAIRGFRKGELQFFLLVRKHTMKFGDSYSPGINLCAFQRVHEENEWFAEVPWEFYPDLLEVLEEARKCNGGLWRGNAC